MAQEAEKRKRENLKIKKEKDAICKGCPRSKKAYDLYGVTLTKDTCVFVCKQGVK